MKTLFRVFSEKTLYRIGCLSGSKIQSIPKRYSENFNSFSPRKNGTTESVSTQKVIKPRLKEKKKKEGFIKK